MQRTKCVFYQVFTLRYLNVEFNYFCFLQQGQLKHWISNLAKKLLAVIIKVTNSAILKSWVQIPFEKSIHWPEIISEYRPILFCSNPPHFTIKLFLSFSVLWTWRVSNENCLLGSALVYSTNQLLSTLTACALFTSILRKVPPSIEQNFAVVIFLSKWHLCLHSNGIPLWKLQMSRRDGSSFLLV